MACLTSLTAPTYPSFSIIVVDNGSTDGTDETVAAWSKLHLNVLVIRHEQNLGFTGGCNAGIRQALDAGAQYILLLNNDTEATPDFLTILVEAAEADMQIGITGPKVHRFGPGKIIDTAGTHAIPWLAQRFLLGHGEEDVGQYDRHRPVPGTKSLRPANPAEPAPPFKRTTIFAIISCFYRATVGSPLSNNWNW